MNSWDETVELIHQLEAMKSSPSNDFLSNLFKQIRKSKMSKSDIVIKYGPNLVKSIYDEREGIYQLFSHMFMYSVSYVR